MPKKGNITGHPFEFEVRKQIEVRERYLGADPRADRHLLFSSNQNAWLRLASSIQINDFIPPVGSNVNNGQILTADKILEQRGLPPSLKGNLLAQKSVLFGGVSEYTPENGGFKPYFGVADPFDKNNPFTAAYGWGGIVTGYLPMPGIQSANISFYNRGALMRADISCKVFSIEQLQVFDLLYFRIGYTMLLEWGHTLYPGNEYNSQIGDYPLVERKDFTTEAIKTFFQGGVVQNNILDSIKKERKLSSYNYDAMLGKIVNFSWKFSTDGTYDINLQLISLGDVVENLKINTTSTNPKSKAVTPSNKIEKAAKQLSLATQTLSTTREANAISDTETDKTNDTTQQTADTTLQNAETALNTAANNLNAVIEAAEANALLGTKAGGRTAAPSSDQESFYKTQGLIDNFNTALLATRKENENLYAKNIIAWKTAADNYNIALNSSAKIESEIETTSKNREKRDNALERNEAALEAAERALEAERERQELFPESAAEYANRTKFNERLYEWITELQDKDFVQHSLNEKYNPKKYQDQNLVYPYSVVAAGAYVSKTQITDLVKLKFSSPSSVAGYDPQRYDQYYVRLGYMLEWMEDNLLLYSLLAKNDQSATENKKKTPYLTIDTDPYSNFCLRFDIQLSSDPQMCIIPLLYDGTAKKIDKKTDQTGKETSTESQINLNWNYLTGKKNLIDKAGNKTVVESKEPNLSFYLVNPVTEVGETNIKQGLNVLIENQLNTEPISFKNNLDGLLKAEGIPKDDSSMKNKGRVMNIMVNIDHIARILKDQVDGDGRVALVGFFQALFESINDCLGGVNKLEAVYDADDNKIKIIEATSLDDESPLEQSTSPDAVVTPSIAQFTVYGLPISNQSNPSLVERKGSFVTNVDFQVQLPPKFAQMATISARAQGNIPGENSTAISRLNYGLVDRIIKEKLDAESVGVASEKSSTSPELIFGNRLDQINTYIAQLYSTRRYVLENVENLKSINRDVALYYVGDKAEKGQGPAPFFIPFNLSLDMVGLSGMKNYERFAITETILPYSYRSNTTQNPNGVIDFLIKGISHTISDGKWTTKIESLAVASNRKKPNNVK